MLEYLIAFYMPLPWLLRWCATDRACYVSASRLSARAVEWLLGSIADREFGDEGASVQDW
jgi:hypothetical protein